MKIRSQMIILLGVVLLFSCQKRQKEKEQEPEPRATPSTKTQGWPVSRYLVGFSQCTFEDPWRTNMNKEMEDAADAYKEIKLVITNGENRNDKQIADVENFSVMGMDFLIISPREAAPLTPVTSAGRQ